MNIGTITTTNQKGQIVIPKKIRNALHITSDMPLHVTLKDEGIYIHPISNIITQSKNDNAYLKLLRETQGAWAGDDWDEMRKRREKIELAASKKRKEAW